MDLISNNLITIITLIAMGVIWWFAYGKKFLHDVKENPYIESDASQAAASLGVLGTFFGITCGLFSFDTSGLETSVPALLDGMKSAFLTSILGMIGSLGVKFYQRKKQKEYDLNNVINSVNEDATIADLIMYLKEQDKIRQNSFNKQILEAIENVNKAISGENDTTLLSQIKNLRLAVIDSQNNTSFEIKHMREELVSSFNAFAEKMAENNSKVFMEALRETIQDFNSKIQEQFGDNFKQLNIAVGKLLDWQEEYKNTIIEVTENQKQIFAGIEQAKISLESMAYNSDSIQKSAQLLSDIILTAQRYEIELEKALRTLIEISTEAKKVVPSINDLTLSTTNNIKQISQATQNEISKSATQISTIVNDSTNLLDKHFSNIIANVDTNYKEITNLLLSHSQTINNTVIKTNQQFVQLNTDLKNTILDMTNKYNLAVNASAKNMIDTIQDTTSSMNNMMNNETRELLSSLQNVAQNAIKLISLQQNAMNTSFNDTIRKLESSTEKALKSIDNAAIQLENSGISITKTVSDRLFNSNEDLKKYNENVHKIFNENLISFSNQLIQLSRQFAKDYAPLTERLRQIVEISKNIKINN
ncbi:hypothetical protein [Megamonas hypermegale]|uniref:hypothetical protein n=1 Tax=Megamonas hypermegale TaxID=158847 RepID=UPI0026EE28B2|nr:hypothetical protein [Megamonas hypermegale]